MIQWKKSLTRQLVLTALTLLEKIRGHLKPPEVPPPENGVDCTPEELQLILDANKKYRTKEYVLSQDYFVNTLAEKFQSDWRKKNPGTDKSPCLLWHNTFSQLWRARLSRDVPARVLQMNPRRLNVAVNRERVELWPHDNFVFACSQSMANISGITQVSSSTPGRSQITGQGSSSITGLSSPGPHRVSSDNSTVVSFPCNKRRRTAPPSANIPYLISSDIAGWGMNHLFMYKTRSILLILRARVLLYLFKFSPEEKKKELPKDIGFFGDNTGGIKIGDDLYLDSFSPSFKDHNKCMKAAFDCIWGTDKDTRKGLSVRDLAEVNENKWEFKPTTTDMSCLLKYNTTQTNSIEFCNMEFRKLRDIAGNSGLVSLEYMRMALKYRLEVSDFSRHDPPVRKEFLSWYFQGIIVPMKGETAHEHVRKYSPTGAESTWRVPRQPDH